MSASTFLDGRVTLHGGDCRAVLASLPDASVDSVVTDPPYALVSIGKRFGAEGAAPAKAGATGAYARAAAGFMGKTWDTGETAFAVSFWAEVLRVLKPGGHVISFGGTRSHHHMWSAIEAAGFEIRDSLLHLFDLDPIVAAFFASLDPGQQQSFLSIMDQIGPGGMLAWSYGSGFPKSHDVSKGIDKAAGAVREVVGKTTRRVGPQGTRKVDGLSGSSTFRENPDNPDNPGNLATAPATDAARQWQGWGTALKPAWEPIVLARKPLTGTVAETVLAHGTGALNIDGCRVGDHGETQFTGAKTTSNTYGKIDVAGGKELPPGRWPANIVHDGSDEVVAAFPESKSGALTAAQQVNGGFSGTVNCYGTAKSGGTNEYAANSGSAARFFYSAKADKTDRMGSGHPTVKPVDLMQWLCRLVTPPGGVVLDPFAGSGSTGEAAWREGFRAILIEREAEYQADIARRMELCLAGPAERARESIKAKTKSAPVNHGPLFGAMP